MRRLTIAAAGTIMSGAILFVSAPAYASSVEPTQFQGTAACSNFSDRWMEVKAAPHDGTYTDGTLTATITNFNGTSFDWSSNITLDAVLVSGADGSGNFYRYEPDESSDSGMQAPSSPSGDPSTIADVVFCYGSSNVPSPSPSATPTASPPPTVLGNSTLRAPEPSTKVKGERFIAETGSDLPGLLFVGFALLLMGATTRAFADRSMARRS